MPHQLLLTELFSAWYNITATVLICITATLWNHMTATVLY